MKRKLFIILSTLVLITTLIFSFAFKDNKENIKEIPKVEKILSKPEGIQAYTLDNEKTNISYENLINYYTLDKITCKNGTIATFNKIDNSVSLSNIHMPDYCTMNFTDKTLYSHLMKDNSTIKTRTDYSTTFTETNTGTLYKTTESIAGSTPVTVYYFSGNAKNNWLKFGTWKENKRIVMGYSSDQTSYAKYDSLHSCNNSETNNFYCEEINIANVGDPMYWRIIRTNHDGSVRLLYSGTSPSSTNTGLELMYFNDVYNTPCSVGYKYGNSSSLDGCRENTKDSSAKIYLENWFSKNLIELENYTSSNAVYCNNRTLGISQSFSNDSEFNYYGKNLIIDGVNPSYNCNDIRDAFSVLNKYATINYSIALMTVDEVIFASGAHTEVNEIKAYYSVNSNNEKNTDTAATALLTPALFARPYEGAGNLTGNIAFINNLVGYNSNGKLGYSSWPGKYVIRPVISIKGDNLWSSGDGSASNPYTIKEV